MAEVPSGQEGVMLCASHCWVPLGCASTVSLSPFDLKTSAVCQVSVEPGHTTGRL